MGGEDREPKGQASDSEKVMGPMCAVLNRFSCIRLFATLWTVAHKAPLSIGFSRQEYWSGRERGIRMEEERTKPGDVPE